MAGKVLPRCKGSVRLHVWRAGQSLSSRVGVRMWCCACVFFQGSSAGIFHPSLFPSILTQAFLKIIFLKRRSATDTLS